MRQVILVATLLGLCVAQVTRPEFTSAAGTDALSLGTRYSDPCASGFLSMATMGGVTTIQRCTALKWPQSSSTISAPSDTSTGVYDVNNKYTITLTGQEFDKAFPVQAAAGAGTKVGEVYLSGLDQDCTNVATDVTTVRDVLYRSGTTLDFETQPGLPGAANRKQWNEANPLELQDQPRRLCFRTLAGTSMDTGFSYQVVYACNTNADCAAPNHGTGNSYLDMLPWERDVIRARTTCCRGTCYDTNVRSCCEGGAGVVYKTATEKCCNGAWGITAMLDSACPCTTAMANPSTPQCPTTESSCCLPTKYSELTAPADCRTGQTGNTLCGKVWGECYNPQMYRCCDTGSRYDPGSQQCCKINGLQSLKFPCPCEADSDCWGGQTNSYQGGQDFVTGHRCCKQSAPGISNVDGPVCSMYTNYPSGTASFRNTRCSGVCFDSRYQICCNGAVCRREFEKCCNTTCCNRFTGTCADGRRAGSRNMISNWNDFGTTYEQCTTVEKLDEVKAFWIFILPAALGLATLGALALVLVFANKASARVFSFIEKCVIGIALFTILLAAVLFFSPAYKYGLIAVLVALLAIVAAAARIRFLNVVALFAVGICLWYWIDPVPANDYLNMGYMRGPPGQGALNADDDVDIRMGVDMDDDNNLVPTDDDTAWPHKLDADDDDANWPSVFPYTHGIFHSLDALFRFPKICTGFYLGYFELDDQLRDWRFDNPEVTTFAYCSRGYITGLMLLAAILLVLLGILFILLLLALILRFRKNRLEPIELEVRQDVEPLLGGPLPPY